MVENVIIDVCNFLKSKNVLIPSQNQWLRGCITCFREITPDYTPKQLKDFVFDQWKLADLRDISAPTLPNNCKTSLKFTLPGKYAVQINYAVNIGESFYKQLHKIRQPTAGENLDVDADKDKSNTEPSANRTLKLEITDGVVTMLGFEDKPIRKLVEPFVPGVKAILNGPIECKKGVMFLKNENIDLIGGEVDTLYIPNALENILARALGQPENPDPYKSLSTNDNTQNQENILDEDDDAFLQIPDDIGNMTNIEIAPSNPSVHSLNNNGSRREMSTSSSFNTNSTLNNSTSYNSNTFRQTDSNSLSRIESTIEPTQNQSLNNSVIEIDDNDDELFAMVDETALSAANTTQTNKATITKQTKLQSFFSNKTSSSSSSTKNQPSTFQSEYNKKSNSSDKKDSKSSDKIGKSSISSSNGLRAQLEESYADFLTSESSDKPTSDNSSRRTSNSDKETKDLFTGFNIIQDDKEIKSKRVNQIEEDISFPPKKYPSTQIVKCCVEQLSQKLSIQDERWRLSAFVKIQGTEIEVDFSPDALDKVFGMTAKELQAKRQEVKQNPQLKEKMNQLLKSSQRRIQKLNCDMKISFTNYINKPVILEIFD